MPTIITHAVIPIAASIALGKQRIATPLLVSGMLVAMLPDADVVAFTLGIAYSDGFGHRGASHSFLFAGLVALTGALLHKRLRASFWMSAAWLFACAASHPLLDALTNGGLGVALAWPWSDARFFAPWRPIQVSPIGIGFFSARGVAVMQSELTWVWLPTLVAAVAAMAIRRQVTASNRA